VPGGGCPFCASYSAQTDPNSFRMGDGVGAVWADGFRPRDASILETKCVGPADRSPYVPGSGAPELVRAKARQALAHEIERYTEVWRDPATPVRGLEIVTDDPRAVPYLEEILSGYEIPSRVVVRAYG
jgi:hypothetical protein